MNVLSLFDGMSCGRIALERAGIPVNMYIASEIDKYAIQIAKKNYPDTVHIGDVRRAVGYALPKIDLLTGGSPCQGFSFAGKQLNFDDPRSAFFFEYVRLLRETGARWFLLENVVMKKEYQAVISSYLGVLPIKINSALVSAQNRKRLYWTNIPWLGQPADRGVMLESIICGDVVPVIKKMGKLVYKPHKSQCLDSNYHKSPDNHGQRTGCIEVGHAVGTEKRRDMVRRVYHPNGKSPTLLNGGGAGGPIPPKVASSPRHWRKITPLECERLQTVPDGYTGGVSNTQRYRMLGNGWTVDVIAHILGGLNNDQS